MPNVIERRVEARHRRTSERRVSAWFAGAATAFALAASVQAAAQEAPPVTLDVLVLDRDGRPAPDLGVGDFEVVDQGSTRAISRVRVLPTPEEPRRFVFVVNRRGALPDQLRRFRSGIESFLEESFGEQDEAMFVDFGDVPRITTGWRRGGAAALAEVDELVPIGFQGVAGGSQDAADAAYMLYALSERLAATPGRKIVVMFSRSLSTFGGRPGLGRDPWFNENAGVRPSGQPGADDAELALAGAFRRARTTVYAVHLEGARTQDDGILVRDRDEMGRMDTTNTASGVQGATRVRNSSASISGRSRAAFSRPVDDFLSSLASSTGGDYTARATDLAAVLNRIEAANRAWYELSVGAASAAPDPRAPALEVRAPNHPDLRVIARPGALRE